MGIISKTKTVIDARDDDVSTICPGPANVAEMYVSRQRKWEDDRLHVGVIATHNR